MSSPQTAAPVPCSSVSEPEPEPPDGGITAFCINSASARGANGATARLITDERFCAIGHLNVGTRRGDHDRRSNDLRSNDGLYRRMGVRLRIRLHAFRLTELDSLANPVRCR